jgi:hypothetical protein
MSARRTFADASSTLNGTWPKGTVIMPGAIAANPYQGYRSEYLAQYVFSEFGTSLPVNQGDYGIDLFCTLTERKGLLAWPYAYYSVQVKSAARRWRMKSRNEVDWLVNYPAPLLYCIVNKRKTEFRIYQTSARFQASVIPMPPARMVLIPGEKGRGGAPRWASDGNFQLGPPILQFTVAQLGDNRKVDQFRKVLDAWVRIDQANVRRRQMGMRTWSVPPRYQTNRVPPATGRATASLISVTPEIQAEADSTAVELLNWLGLAKLDDGDRVAAVLAGMLCRQLLGKQPRARPENVPELYTSLLTGGWLDAAIGAGGYVAASLDKLLGELRHQVSD